MITLDNVTKRYGNRTVLDGISVSIGPGELVCVTGPSGAGKSTLIHILAGALPATEGHMTVDGVDLRDVPEPVMRLFRRRVGLVFQDYKLLCSRTVRENIAFPLEVCGVPEKRIRERVDHVLEQMGLTALADALPDALSGGEQARTAIARAIVHEPIVLLADEPTGNLDPDQSVLILDLFRGIHRTGTTVIIATHDATMVDALQSRVVRLHEGQLERDSMGGYRQESGQLPEAKAERDHAILPKDTTGGGSKVKITSLSS